MKIKFSSKCISSGACCFQISFPQKTTVLSRPKLYFTVQTLVITDSNLAASSVMATSAQHQNKVFFIVCFIRSLVFPTTATLLLLGATVYLVFYTFHQESLMGFVPPAMVGLLSLIFLPLFTKMFCSWLHVSSKH